MNSVKCSSSKELGKTSMHIFVVVMHIEEQWYPERLSDLYYSVSFEGLVEREDQRTKLRGHNS